MNAPPPKSLVAAYVGAWLAELLTNDCEGQSWLKNDTLYLRTTFMIAGQRWVDGHAVSLIEFREANLGHHEWSRVGEKQGAAMARRVRGYIGDPGREPEST